MMSKVKTPYTSSKRKCIVDNDKTFPFIVTAHKEIKAAFCEDTTWHSTRWLTGIKSSNAWKLLQDWVHLWLVFTMAFEPVALFGPKNNYSVRHVNKVTRFIVEQWGVRPLQMTRHPAGGKMIHYLLVFDHRDMRKILFKFLQEWTKLTQGIRCCIFTLAETFTFPFPAMVSHVPIIVSVWTMKKTQNIYPESNRWQT